jgi:hypothetical protein
MNTDKTNSKWFFVLSAFIGGLFAFPGKLAPQCSSLFLASQYPSDLLYRVEKARAVL